MHNVARSIPAVKMKKTVLCLALMYISTSIVHGADSLCEDGWTAYNDEKCVKLFEIFASRAGADEVCRQQGTITDPFVPRLVAIRSPAEQKFLSEMAYNASADMDIWIGAERRPDTNQFDWNDGSAVQRYSNWGENRPTDDERRLCVRMMSSVSMLSTATDMKWSDHVCAQPTWFICERMPSWPFEHFQQAIIDARRELQHNVYSFNNLMAELKNQLKEAQDTSIPIGFMYPQLPHQLPPWRLWPTMEWSDISDEYAGLFFRVVGQGSGQFETTQAENSPRLTSVRGRLVLSAAVASTVVTANNGNSPTVSAGATGAASHWGLSFTVSSGEVRPRNTAMRMWQRTG